MLEGLNFRLDIVCDSTTGCPRIVLGLLAVQFMELARDALVALLEEFRQLVRGEVVRFGIDRSQLAPVDGHEFPGEEVELLTQHRELATDLPQRLQVVLAEVRHCLVIWAQLLS